MQVSEGSGAPLLLVLSFSILIPVVILATVWFFILIGLCDPCLLASDFD